MTDVVSFCRNGGRIAHYNETDDNGELIVTIAYCRVDGNIHFGGTIYRPGGDAWAKQPHTETAVSRVMIRPNIIPDHDMSGRERQAYVREAMRAMGCRGRRVKVG